MFAHSQDALIVNFVKRLSLDIITLIYSIAFTRNINLINKGAQNSITSSAQQDKTKCISSQRWQSIVCKANVKWRSVLVHKQRVFIMNNLLSCQKILSKVKREILITKTRTVGGGERWESSVNFDPLICFISLMKLLWELLPFSV